VAKKIKSGLGWKPKRTRAHFKVRESKAAVLTSLYVIKGQCRPFGRYLAFVVAIGK
jgi:hypothetical protein